jgi:hypothetical protein
MRTPLTLSKGAYQMTVVAIDAFDAKVASPPITMTVQ